MKKFVLAAIVILSLALVAELWLSISVPRPTLTLGNPPKLATGVHQLDSGWRTIRTPNDFVQSNGGMLIEISDDWMVLFLCKVGDEYPDLVFTKLAKPDIILSYTAKSYGRISIDQGKPIFVFFEMPPSAPNEWSVKFVNHDDVFVLLKQIDVSRIAVTATIIDTPALKIIPKISSLNAHGKVAEFLGMCGITLPNL